MTARTSVPLNAAASCACALRDGQHGHGERQQFQWHRRFDETEANRDVAGGGYTADTVSVLDWLLVLLPDPL